MNFVVKIVRERFFFKCMKAMLSFGGGGDPDFPKIKLRSFTGHPKNGFDFI